MRQALKVAGGSILSILLFANMSVFAQVFPTSDGAINFVQTFPPIIDYNAVDDSSGHTATPQSMSFTPSKTQRKKNIAGYISRVTKIAPDYAPKLAAEFGDGTVFDQYGQMLGGIGLNANDLGDNLAVWWITAWEAAQGRPVQTNPASFVKVKAQVARILSEKALTAMSNADKQRYSDNLTIQTLVLSNQIDQAKANPAMARQLADGVKAGAKKMGFDLAAMTLTKDGFVRNTGRKTGAAENSSKAANPAAAETAGAGLGGVVLFAKAMGRKG
jgi:hypothetical protein